MTRRFPNALPFALFVLTPFFVFPAAMLGAGMMDGGDDKLSNLPLLLHSGRKLLAGEIFWSTDLWMGMPLLGEPEAATFYLPRLLLLLFPPAAGYAAYVLLHFVGAQATMYLYLRRLELLRAPATLGAVGYAFTGFMLGHAGHTMYVVAGAWAPLFLYFVHRATVGEGRVAWSLLGAMAAFAGAFFGGAVQLSVYLLSLAGLLHLSMSVFGRSWRPLATYVAVALSGLLLIAPQLLVSIDSTQSLAVATRHDYAFATDLSFPPLLFPTLILPTRPLEYAELYSRVGLAVLAAAAVGAVGSMRRTPTVRAWLVVLAVAFVLMLGRYVSPVARTLHAIPGLYFLRGPARHNFELGMALSVLAAFGAQELLQARSRRIQIGPVVASGAAVLSIAGLLAARDGWLNIEHGSMLTEIPARLVPVVVMVAITVAAAWFGLSRLAGGRHARFLPAALLVLTLGETKTAESLDADMFWNGVARPGVPRTPPSPAASFTRIVPPDLRKGGYPTWPGNAVLYFPGVQSLFGYASIAPNDAVTTFDLDMHGHPRFAGDLLWSRLPELYGATHVVMPEVLCGVTRAAIDPSEPIDAACKGEPAAFALQTGERRCALSLGTQPIHFRVDAEVRSARRPRGPVELGLWSSNESARIATISVDPKEIKPAFTPVGGTIDLVDFPGEGWLGAYMHGAVPVEVRGLRLSVFTLSSNELVWDAPVVLSGERTIQRRFPVPIENTTYRLEVVARRMEGSPKLVLDLYDGVDFDPEGAQVVVDGGLSDRPQLFAKEFTLASHPASTLVRAFVEGSGSAEVTSARWMVEERTVIARMTSGLDARLKACEFRGDDLLLGGPDSGAILRVQLPVRPVVLTAELAPDGGESNGIVGIGLAADLSSFSDANEVVLQPGALTRDVRLRRGVALPADATTAFLRAYSQGTRRIDVRSFAADDACRAARYVPERPIEGGLWLYRTEHPLPRAFTVATVTSVDSIDEARDELRTSHSFDPHTTALVQLEGVAQPGELHAGTIDEVRFGGESVDLTIASPDGPTFVVINDHYDPHFTATVDGTPTRIFRTNALVRGLFIPVGRHRVSLRYRPPAVFYVGLCAALVGLVLGGVLFPRLLVKRTGGDGNLG